MSLAVHILKDNERLLVAGGNKRTEPGGDARVCDVRELIWHPGHVLGCVILLENRSITNAPIVLVLLGITRRECDQCNQDRHSSSS